MPGVYYLSVYYRQVQLYIKKWLLFNHLQGPPYIFVTFHSLEIEKSYLKSAATLLSTNSVKNEGLEVSIEVS